MDYSKENENVINFLKDYNNNSGTKGYAIGISGGIDSALCASLAARAVGKDNVYGLYLPCKSSKNMEEDAIILAENLGINFNVIDLTNIYNHFVATLSTSTKMVKANLKARLRMVSLYSLANQNNLLVCGTCNLSETMIGYETKFGDGASDISPIGSYYKTEIYQMADAFPEIPKSIKTKAPSADLWEGQTDEQEIGMSYEKLDSILEYYNQNFGYFCEAGNKFSLEDFNKVKSMIIKSSHKRKMSPVFERYENI